MTDQVMDGNGRRAKTTQRHYDEQSEQWVTDDQTYYVNSTVLGQPLTELGTSGAKQQTYVYGNGALLARQSFQDNSEYLTWEHRDPGGASVRGSDAAGQPAGAFGELDPLGANAGTFKPFIWTQPRSSGQLVPFRGLPDMSTGGRGCVIDGIEQDCPSAYDGATEIDLKTSPEAARTIGAIPTWGKFCSQVQGSKQECYYAITGYTSPLSLAGSLNSQPQNPSQAQTPCERKLAGIFGGKRIAELQA